MTGRRFVVAFTTRVFAAVAACAEVADHDVTVTVAAHSPSTIPSTDALGERMRSRPATSWCDR